MDALIDNDILMKGACYGLLDELLLRSYAPTTQVGILGAAKFVLSKAIQKRQLHGEPESVIARLNTFIDNSCIVEPTEAEQRLAADLELQAQRIGVALDAGESQLCAVLIIRELRSLRTGDKRAIKAMEQLLAADERLRPMCGKVQCLEQLMIRCISESNLPVIRATICAEPNVDKTLGICFSCGSLTISLEVVRDCLNSYVSDLRRHAPQILAA
jgi:hypothetical protein